MLSPIIMQRLIAGEKLSFIDVDWEGFISPDGEMIYAVSGDHGEKAMDLLQERYGVDCGGDPVDDLIVLGWIVIHKCDSDTNTIHYPTRLTEYQKAALHDLEIYGSMDDE